MKEARADKVSDRACKRGMPQLGTLGSVITFGNPGHRRDIRKECSREAETFQRPSRHYDSLRLERISHRYAPII